MTRLRLITAAVPLLALVLLGTASGDDYIEARRLMQRGDIKPLETIIEQLGRSHPGRILEVELEAERAESDPKVFTRIHAHFRIGGRGLTDKVVDRAIRMSAEKYCSASIMLGATAEITHDFEIIES